MRNRPFFCAETLVLLGGGDFHLAVLVGDDIAAADVDLTVLVHMDFGAVCFLYICILTLRNRNNLYFPIRLSCLGVLYELLHPLQRSETDDQIVTFVDCRS